MSLSQAKRRSFGLMIMGAAAGLVIFAVVVGSLLKNYRAIAEITPESRMEGCSNQLIPLRESGIFKAWKPPAVFVVNLNSWIHTPIYRRRQAIQTFQCVAVNGREREDVDLEIQILAEDTGALIATANGDLLVIDGAQ